MAALISVSLVHSQTPAYTARTNTGLVHHGVSCLHPSFPWYSLHLHTKRWKSWVDLSNNKESSHWKKTVWFAELFLDTSFIKLLLLLQQLLLLLLVLILIIITTTTITVYNIVSYHIWPVLGYIQYMQVLQFAQGARQFRKLIVSQWQHVQSRTVSNLIVYTHTRTRDITTVHYNYYYYDYCTAMMEKWPQNKYKSTKPC